MLTTLFKLSFHNELEIRHTILNYDMSYPVLSSFMTYHQVCNESSITGATSGAGKALEHISIFSRVRVTRSQVLCVVFCRSLLVLFSFIFWPLCCLSFFNLRHLIIPLVFSNFAWSMESRKEFQLSCFCDLSNDAIESQALVSIIRETPPPLLVRGRKPPPPPTPVDKNKCPWIEYTNVIGNTCTMIVVYPQYIIPTFRFLVSFAKWRNSDIQPILACLSSMGTSPCTTHWRVSLIQK